MVVANASSDSSDDDVLRQSQNQAPPKLHKLATGLMAWSLTVGLWVGLEAWQLWKSISAWEVGAPPPEVTQQSGRCPCSCAQGSNDDVHLRPEFEFCTEGDACFFGKQWCARSIPDFASSAHTSQFWASVEKTAAVDHVVWKASTSHVTGPSTLRFT